MARRLGSQHLDALRAVVMTGSMTKAAQERHTSQSQISRLVAQLEDIVGFSVFLRRGTRISMSLEGARLYDEVEKYYAGLTNIEAAAAAIRSFDSEHLRVAAMPRLAGGILTRAVARFKHDYPNTKISIYVSTANTLQEWIKSGKCDVGLSMSYGRLSSDVKSVAITTVACVCVLPAGHRFESKECLSAQDLAGENFITFIAGSSLRTEIDQFFSQAGVQPNIVMEAELGASVCTLVEAGIGVSLMNPIAAREEAVRANIVIRPISPSFMMTLELVYTRRLHHSLFIGQFEEYIQDEVNNAHSY